MKKLSLAIRFGLVTGAILIAYFLILALVHKHTNPAFSFLNAAITAFGIYEAVRLKKLENSSAFSYAEGFRIAIVTGFVATFVFAVFFLFYITEVNSLFLPTLLETIGWGNTVTTGMISFVVIVMGLTTTVVSALTVMQLFKNSRNIIQNS